MPASIEQIFLLPDILVSYLNICGVAISLNLFELILLVLMKKRQGKRASTKRIKKPKPAMLVAGETFGKSNLPKITGKMYSRLSQILGIPVKELTPVYIENVYFSTYYPAYHEARIGLGGKEHELLHSLQILLQKGPRAEMRRSLEKFHHKKKTSLKEIIGILSRVYSIKDPDFRTYLDPSARVADSQIRQPVMQTLSNPYATPFLISAALFSWKAIPIAFLVSVPHIYRGMATRHYYKKHGADGLILLFADPPKNLDLLHLRKREKEFVEKGYLKKRGGFTRKGIQYLRQIMPRGLVLERLQDWKRFREKRKTARKE